MLFRQKENVQMLIGLTGSFGNGKSTVLKIFRELGALTLSADAIVHALLERPDVKDAIRAAIGEKVFTGSEIDRKKLAERIFDSEKERRKLENILHPLVYREIMDLREKNPGMLIVAEIPLLLESGRCKDFDFVILVTCRQEEAEKRLIQRGFSSEEIKKRLGAQMSVEEKRKHADFVVDNSGSPEETRRQVEALWKTLAHVR